MNTQWIKRSEREPMKGDLPIVTTCYHDRKWVVQLWTEWLPDKDHESTHWRSIKCEPPPRELTQRERDEAMARLAATTWYADHTTQDRHQIGLLAIYAERREVAKLLHKWMIVDDWGQLAGHSPELRAIRARCDEQGAK